MLIVWIGLFDAFSAIFLGQWVIGLPQRLALACSMSGSFALQLLVRHKQHDRLPVVAALLLCGFLGLCAPGGALELGSNNCVQSTFNTPILAHLAVHPGSSCAHPLILFDSHGLWYHYADGTLRGDGHNVSTIVPCVAFCPTGLKWPNPTVRCMVQIAVHPDICPHISTYYHTHVENAVWAVTWLIFALAAVMCRQSPDILLTLSLLLAICCAGGGYRSVSHVISVIVYDAMVWTWLRTRYTQHSQ